MTNLYIPVFALLITLLTNIVFFSKKRFKSKETDLYKIMLLVSLMDSIILFLIIFLGYIGFYTMLLIKILNIIDFIMYMLWISSFYLYIISLDSKNNFKKNQKITKCLNIIVLILIITTPISPYNNNGIMYVDGVSVNILYITIAIYLILIILSILKNIKNIFNKKYIPLYSLIIIIIFALIIRKLNPALIITSAVLSFMNLIMMFTIENPDLKLLEEIEFNKKIIEKNNEEKSNLLFKISQDVRVPIKEIENKSIDLLNVKNKKDIISLAKDINSESKNLSFIVDNILNINTFDINKIKLYNTKFNIYNLCDEIKLIIKNKNNKNIKFDFNIYNEIPLLYGDDVRLKQIICSLINYSLIYNESDYVFLDISGLLRYDICRLIINIKDNGKNISIDKINNILNDNINMDKLNLNINDLNLEIESINKIIKLLNGTFFIKSNKELGNDYSIVIDYEVADKTFMLNFNNSFFSKKKVLLINDNTEELKKYAKLLKSKGIDVTTCMFGKDCIDKTKYGEVYDLILIDDEMQPYNAIETYNELKKDINFKTKVIIMLGLNKEFIKEHYIRDYKFSDYLIKRSYEKELNRIIDKYL